VACAEIRQCCSGLERGRRLAKAQKKDLHAVRLWFILVAMEAAFLACAAAIVARAVDNVFGVASSCSIALKQKRGAGRLAACRNEVAERFRAARAWPFCLNCIAAIDPAWASHGFADHFRPPHLPRLGSKGGRAGRS
jgi:hypothetical protein